MPRYAKQHPISFSRQGARGNCIFEIRRSLVKYSTRSNTALVPCSMQSHCAVPAFVTERCKVVTKRRNSWACRGNPNPEQETIKGTHTQDTPAYQRRPTTQYAAQGSNPPIERYTCSKRRYHTHIKPHRLPPGPQAQTSTAPTADVR